MSAKTWTHKQPRYPGWYWTRWKIASHWVAALPIYVTSEMLPLDADAGQQWAGPIAPPREP